MTSDAQSEGERPQNVEVRRRKEGAGWGDYSGGIQIGTWHPRTPLGRAVGGVVGLLVAALVVGVVFLIVLPVVLLVVLLAMLAGPLALLAAIVGLPLAKVLTSLSAGLRTLAGLPGLVIDAITGRRR